MLIVFEGTDASGKTTMCKRVLQSLAKRVKHVKVGAVSFPSKDCREATKGMIGEELASAYIQDMSDSLFHSHAMGDRIILTDRYVVSTFVYQHHLGGVCREFIEKRIKEVRLPMPSLLFYLQRPINLLHDEFKRRGEVYSESDILAMREAYTEEILKRQGTNLVEIDTTIDIDKNAEFIADRVVLMLEQNGLKI